MPWAPMKTLGESGRVRVAESTGGLSGREALLEISAGEGHPQLTAPAREALAGGRYEAFVEQALVDAESSAPTPAACANRWGPRGVR